MLSIINPKPPYDPKVRRQMTRLMVFGTVIVLALFCFILASIFGFLPNWVASGGFAALGVASWFLTGRAESLRKRLRTTSEH